MAGVALGDIHLHFAWQAWHLVTSTVTLRGRRGTHGIGLALVARLVLGVTPWRRGVLRGRRGTWRHPPSLCVAGVALGDIHLHFAWQAWHLVTSTVTLRGRRGTYGTGLALVARLGTLVAAAVCVAGVALGDIDLHFAWQAWHLVTSTFTLRGKRVTKCTSICALRGRCGAYGTVLDWLWWRAWVPVDAVDAAVVCVPGMALGDIDFHFAWQVWHLLTSSFTLRGRRATLSTHNLSTPSLTHHRVTHHLSHSPSLTHPLSHTIFHTPLCHTPSFTHHL